jgi:hypothetical protein
MNDEVAHSLLGGNSRSMASCFVVVRFVLALTQLRHRPSRTESKDTRRHLLILRFGCEDRVQGKPVFPVFPVQGHLNT